MTLINFLQGKYAEALRCMERALVLRQHGVTEYVQCISWCVVGTRVRFSVYLFVVCKVRTDPIHNKKLYDF